jgi:hypothetical protein
MASIAAIFLTVMNEEEAFYSFEGFMSCYGLVSLFNPNSPATIQLFNQLDALLEIAAPAVAQTWVSIVVMF